MAEPSARPDYATPAIDAFGDQGFRVAGTRHEGSIQILGGSVEPWEHPKAPADLTPDHFTAILQADDPPDLVILGIGATMRHPPAPVREAFRQAGIGLEAMDTPTACRAYNVVAGEARRAWAALIAV